MQVRRGHRWMRCSGQVQWGGGRESMAERGCFDMFDGGQGSCTVDMSLFPFGDSWFGRRR